MTAIIWLVVIIMAFEATIFGNDQALIAGLILSAIGIYLEWRNDNVL